MTLFFSRMCEAFKGKLPTEIMAEMDALPAGFLEDIVEARAFERAFFAYRLDPKATGGMVGDVQAIEFAGALEAIDSE